MLCQRVCWCLMAIVPTHFWACHTHPHRYGSKLDPAKNSNAYCWKMNNIWSPPCFYFDSFPFPCAKVAPCGFKTLWPRGVHGFSPGANIQRSDIASEHWHPEKKTTNATVQFTTLIGFDSEMRRSGRISCICAIHNPSPALPFPMPTSYRNCRDAGTPLNPR